MSALPQPDALELDVQISDRERAALVEYAALSALYAAHCEAPKVMKLFVTEHLRVDGAGRVYVADAAGQPRAGRGGYAMQPSQLVAELAADPDFAGMFGR